MGGKQSSHNTPPRQRALSDVGPRSNNDGVLATSSGSSRHHNIAARTRSFGNVDRTFGEILGTSSSNGNFDGSDSSIEEAIHNLPGLMGLLQVHSLPARLFAYRTDIVCPVCKKSVPSDDVERHMVICLTKPRVSYNEDVLIESKGECVICFEDLTAGETIARLPCLCIYHKTCIEAWFQKNRSCPEHPID